MRWFIAMLLATGGCSSSTCDEPCPDGTECVDERCRTACVDDSGCATGEVCFRDYCEVGDRRPDPGDGDQDGGAGDANGDSAGDDAAGDPDLGDRPPGDPAPRCGNNTTDSGESCDGTDLNGRVDCTNFNWGSGDISCMVTCQEFDLSACVNPPGNCGTGTPTGMQQCDGDNLRSETCESLGFSSGTLACNSNCSFDITGCIP